MTGVGSEVERVLVGEWLVALLVRGEVASVRDQVATTTLGMQGVEGTDRGEFDQDRATRVSAFDDVSNRRVRLVVDEPIHLGITDPIDLSER
jgi:hypothetical protein